MYPGGSNLAPADYDSALAAAARLVVPLDSAGIPDPAGKYVLLTVGFSNVAQESCSKLTPVSEPPCTVQSFEAQAAADPPVDHQRLAIVTGATAGQSAAEWDQPRDSAYQFVIHRLAPRG